jgi:hypothetical protein
VSTNRPRTLGKVSARPGAFLGALPLFAFLSIAPGLGCSASGTASNPRSMNPTTAKGGAPGAWSEAAGGTPGSGASVGAWMAVGGVVPLDAALRTRLQAIGVRLGRLADEVMTFWKQKGPDPSYGGSFGRSPIGMHCGSQRPR